MIACGMIGVISMSDVMAASRRGDPDYSQVSGYVKKELALQFKAQCTMSEISQAEALEEAIQLWLQQKLKQ